MTQFDPNNFIGVIPAMITSFNKDESINKEGIRKTVNYLISESVDGLYITGSTGETFLMSQEEKKQAIEIIVEEVNGRVPVIAHIGSIGTKITTELGQYAEKVGVDALSALPPFYYGFSNDEIFNYYKSICEQVNIPIMLYNNPFTTNVDMPANLVAKLTKSFEQIRYIKEASMDVARVFDILVETDGVMNVFAGERIVESYLMGAVGYVNPYGNYIPKASSVICDLMANGKTSEAKQIQHLIDEMQKVIEEAHPTYGHQCYSKALAAYAGYPVGDVRPPLTTFKQLGNEGEKRVKILASKMNDLDNLVNELID